MSERMILRRRYLILCSVAILNIYWIKDPKWIYCALGWIAPGTGKKLASSFGFRY
jgi:hypothetical protein